MKGVVLEKSNGTYHTFLKHIFVSIDNIQTEYNWLITGYECYPKNIKYMKLLAEKYCWISGEELSNMTDDEDFQWIWGVFSAFPQNITKEEVLAYKFPEADGYTGFWKNPVSLQHPLAEIEIVAWDSSLTILISKNSDIIDAFQKNNPLAQDLDKYNEDIL